MKQTKQKHPYWVDLLCLTAVFTLLVATLTMLGINMAEGATNVNPSSHHSEGYYRKYGNFKIAPPHITHTERNAVSPTNYTNHDIPAKWLKTPLFRYFDTKSGQEKYAFRIELPKFNHAYIISGGNQQQTQQIETQVENGLLQPPKYTLDFDIKGSVAFDCGTGKRVAGKIKTGGKETVVINSIEPGYRLIRENGNVTIQSFKVFRR